MYITKSAQGVHVPNLIKIDSAVAALRMREKNRFSPAFLLTYLSKLIYISVLRHAHRSHFLARFLQRAAMLALQALY